MKRRNLVIFSFVLLLFLLIGCPNTAISPYEGSDLDVVRRITSPVEISLGGMPAMYETGVLGPGASYEIWTPVDNPWNGCLVIWAHGYANPSQPVRLPTELTDTGMLSVLLNMGFAVAQSSYSENGWAVKDGAIRTRQLRGYFAGAYKKPAKVYLVGASEGAMISIMLAEKNPELFSGALCIGGPLGGADMEVKYIYNVRILFDCLFGETLDDLVSAGMPLAVALHDALGEGALDAHPPDPFIPPTDPRYLPPDGAAFAAKVVQLIATLFAMNPGGAYWMASTVIGTVPLFNWPDDPALSPQEVADEMAITVAIGLWYNIFGTEDILSRTHGHVPVDNTSTSYWVYPSGPTLDVERLAATPDAANYLDHWYQPIGKLKIPVVILHTSRDPVVPVFHAQAYSQMAAARGSGSHLQVFEIPYFGHCQILTPPDYNPMNVPNTLLFQSQLLNAFTVLLGM